MRPERPLLRLVEPLGDQPLLQAPPAAPRCPARATGSAKSRGLPSRRPRRPGRAARPAAPDRRSPRTTAAIALDLLLRPVAEEGERDVQRLGRHRPQRRVGQRLPPPRRDPRPHRVGQVERHEQARPRALQSLLRHAATLRRRRAHANNAAEASRYVRLDEPRAAALRRRAGCAAGASRPGPSVRGCRRGRRG